MRKMLFGLLSLAISLANVAVFLAANSSSSIWNYQPKEPDSIKKIKL